jgi:hypothetical protein
VSAGLCGGDTARGGASEVQRAATASAVPSAALHRVKFSDACGPRTARMERTSAPRSASSANDSGASLESPDTSTTCTTPSLDMAAARVGSGGGGGGGGSWRRMKHSRGPGVTWGLLRREAGVCLRANAEHALALRPRAPRHRRCTKTRPWNAARVRVGVRLWWRQNSNAGEAAVVPRRRHRNRNLACREKRCPPPPSDARATAKRASRISRRRCRCLAWLVAHAARCQPSPRR